MARQRNPLRDKAKEIWLNSNGVKALVEIATELNKSSSTIRKWKSLDSWDGELKRSAPLNKGSAPFKYDGMKANKNASGNKGAVLQQPIKMQLEMMVAHQKEIKTLLLQVNMKQFHLTI